VLPLVGSPDPRDPRHAPRTRVACADPTALQAHCRAPNAAVASAVSCQRQAMRKSAPVPGRLFAASLGQQSLRLLSGGDQLGGYRRL